MLHKEVINVDSLRVRVTRKSAEETSEASIITNVEVLIACTKREEFLTYFTQKNITLQTECYTGLLKRGLASYFYHKKFNDQHADTDIGEAIENFLKQKIQACLRPCAKLERLVNNLPPGDSFKRLRHLKKEVNDCKDSLLSIFELQNDPYDSELLIKLRKKLEANFDQFSAQIEVLENSTPTAEELQQLFCSQDGAINGSTSIKSLGSFLSTQLHLMAAYGIDEIYHLTNNRLRQAFVMHPGIKALSDAKAALELRALSAKGAREENSQTPVPGELLDLIDPKELPEEKEDKEKWLSLMPYINQLQDIEEINKMLFLLSSKPDDEFENAPFNWRGSAWLMISSAFEVIFSIIHIMASFISFTLEIGCWVINTVSGSNLGMKRFDHWVTWAHARISFVVTCKNELRESYTQHYLKNGKFLNLLWRNKADTSSLSVDSESEQIRMDTDNILNALLSEYSGHRVAAIFGNRIKEIGKAFYNIGTDFKFLLFVRSTREKRKKVFDDKKRAILKDKKTLSDKLNTLLNRRTLASANRREEKEIREEKTEEYGLWNPGVPWVPNQFSSILDVPGEILSGVADQFIEKMFRHNPGSSTLSFLLSMASFGVLMAPITSEHAKIAWMGSFADLLSKHFTGKAVSEGSLTKLLSVFLQWKILVLTTEIGTELSHGNFEFLRAIFKNLDQTALILVALTSLGSSLEVFEYYPLPTDFHPHLVDPSTHPWLNQYIQTSVDVCTFIPHLINTLGEEAASCSQGTIPLRYLEELILGVKVALIAESALASPKRSKMLDIAKVTDALNTNLSAFHEELKRMKEKGKQAIAITELLALQQIHKPRDPAAQAEYENLINLLVLGLHQENLQKRLASLSDRVHPIATQRSLPLSEYKSDIETASQKLKATLNLVNEMECFGSSGFKDKEDGWYFSDYLSDRFDEYISELDKLGRPTQEEHYLKKRYLASFDNKYCDNSVIGIIKFFSIVPFYPVTILWRGIKYACSGSPSIKNGVIKSFSKDMAMLIQLPIDLLRPIRALARAISYTLRLVLGTAAITFASPALLVLWWGGISSGADVREIINGILDYTTVIKFHRFNGTRWLRAIYAKLSLNCNDSQEKDYLNFWEEAVFKKLDANEKLPVRENSTQLIEEILSAQPKKYCLPRRVLVSTSEAQRAYSVYHSSHLSEAEKITKLHTIFKISVKSEEPTTRQYAKADAAITSPLLPCYH